MSEQIGVKKPRGQMGRQRLPGRVIAADHSTRGATLVDLTQIIVAANTGDAAARANLVQAAYDDLRKLAAARMSGERLDHTLTSTALVNEVSLQMLNDSCMPAENRGQFFGYVATAMRNLLIDHARKRGRQKRGGGRQRFEFEEAVVASNEQSEDLLALNEALQKLADIDRRKSQVVEMRYFGGMTNDEVADALGISKASVKRDWTFAKGWLLNELIQKS
jgi:RNA polymerase sigma-70 factor (ECF subfamily)